MIGEPTGFWGKLRRAEDDGPVLAWHPLEHHCADVAAVAEALLKHTLLGARLARLGGQETLDEVTIARLGVLAALHDVGKFNLEFQNKGYPDREPRGGHVLPPLELLKDTGRWGRRLLTAIQCETLIPWVGDDDWVLLALLDASIGHHGKPNAPSSGVDVGIHERRWAPAHGLDPFGAVHAFVTQLRSWFPQAWHDHAFTLPTSSAFQHGFAGLVMLADWVGSDTQFFPYGELADERMAFARENARAAVRAIGLDPSDIRAALGAETPGDDVLFGDASKSPHEVQTVVRDFERERGGGIMVLEAETGSGKTEAAVMRFLTLFHEGLVDSLYFALPTRTAATQLHARLTSMMQRIVGADLAQVILAVPGYLAAGTATGRLLPGFRVLWNDDPRERDRHRRWAAEHCKRYLAGAIVVGTIDQVLLGGLMVNHAHLRSTALLRSLLVVDEVHASDAYMTSVLQTVLAQHCASGGHVLLMSATLGSAARARLLGEGPSGPTLGDALTRPYPLVVQRGGRGAIHERPVASAGRPKQIHCRIEPWSDEPARIVDVAIDAGLRGLRVLIVRNTVRDAVTTQKALLARPDAGSIVFRCEGVPAPHHARFARDDRTALDQALESQFGKPAGLGGRIVVATQTVQQSLDLDADVLLTDLCPMDVLLQRIGRVWRHPDRERPAGVTQGVVVVLCPAEHDLGAMLRENGVLRGTHGIGTVYDDLRVLEATRRQVAAPGGRQLEIPAMNRELVERATHPEALEALSSELGAKWEKHGQHVVGKTYGHRSIADSNAIPWGKEFVSTDGNTWFGFPSGSDARRIPSRLGESDRRVQLRQPVVSPFGKSVREFSVPGWMAREVPEDEEYAEGVRVAIAGVNFAWGAIDWRYDAMGLRKSDDDEEQADD